jgi:hypothetical protein
LIENDLVDELRVMVFLVLLGDGKRHSRRKAKPPLRLTDSRKAPLTYEAA